MRPSFLIISSESEGSVGGQNVNTSIQSFYGLYLNLAMLCFWQFPNALSLQTQRSHVYEK